jgi:ubiquinone biosynthesis accessory factor UbiJ
MLDIVLPLPFLAVANHLLAREAWATDRLKPFAGRRVCVRIAPLPDLHLAVAASGLLESARGEAAPDLAVRLKPGALPGLLARDDRLMRDAEIDGDTDFAAALQFVFRNLKWDAEEDLSRVMGDAAAHRVAAAGRAFVAWQRDAAQRLGDNVAEYLKEESQQLPRPADVADFGRAVAEARDAAERLDKRIARLEAKRTPP